MKSLLLAALAAACLCPARPCRADHASSPPRTSTARRRRRSGRSRRGRERHHRAGHRSARLRPDRRRSPAQAADAEIIVMNGADYDPWMARLVDAEPRRRPRRDRRRGARRPQGRRQSACLVRSQGDAGHGERADGGAGEARPCRQGRLRAAARRLSRHARADRGPGGGRSRRSSPARRWWRPSRSSATWPRRSA